MLSPHRLKPELHTGTRSLAAFSLIELLVVLGIIGLLAAMGIPAIRGMSKSNVIKAADRQLLDDLAYARQRAMADHTTVYVIFVPPAITNTTLFPLTGVTKTDTVLSNLYGGQYTTYALLSLRSVGDQPGRYTPHYLTDWRSLPAGVYIATNKFTTVPQMAPTFNYPTNLSTGSVLSFPFPAANVYATNNGMKPYPLPYIAFNYLGQLDDGFGHAVSTLASAATSEYISLARGSIFYAKDANGGLTAAPADVLEVNPGYAYYTNYTYCQYGTNLPAPDNQNVFKPYNQIHIDPLTGRARLETLRIP